MKRNDDLPDNNPEDDDEPLSDDPDEQLRLENELLKLKLQAETGADLYELSEMPPEVENAFLNNILAFERQLDSMAEVPIFDILGKPDDFPNEQELSDADIDRELERLNDLMRDKGLEVGFSGQYDNRLKYKFITEELFLHETQQFDIPDMVNHFMYEEFHPNHKLSIEALVQEFLDSWLAKQLDPETWVLAEMLQGSERQYSKTEVLTRIDHIFDAYLGFDAGAAEITLTAFEEHPENPVVQGTGYAEGVISYDAQLESHETLHISGAFRLEVEMREGYWAICGIRMPGLTL
ncbi:hypothetical protein [Taibaiella chishuiensis]|uniref:Uncharacterized protein n=1 Tax=Taibaiella chishuiensis TaxID=1434707 RepID=A0A2P8CY45_9BACT|nr:hypothetical protein [Taibaiella chishuiensis]PSK89857.1 hypothetical protein B0I18_110158 [Taibaiella chishuiensis]